MNTKDFEFECAGCEKRYATFRGLVAHLSKKLECAPVGYALGYIWRKDGSM